MAPCHKFNFPVKQFFNPAQNPATQRDFLTPRATQSNDRIAQARQIVQQQLKAGKDKKSLRALMQSDDSSFKDINPDSIGL